MYKPLGIIFGVLGGFLGGAIGFRKLTGIWPGD